jgi:uncharacterized membrane protein YeaQ/YmgE (transglycosylase-associated protein family)
LGITGLCSWLVFGFLAGLVARALMPGPQRMGLLATSGLGIAGAFVGGFLISLLAGGGERGFEASGFCGAVVGAIILLFIAETVFEKRRLR